MSWIDRPRHGWEGLYDSDEKIYSGKREPREELSEEDRIRLEGEESDRIAAAIDTEGLDIGTLEPTLPEKFRPMPEKALNHESIEESQLTREQIEANERAMAEARERARNMSQTVGSLFRR